MGVVVVYMIIGIAWSAWLEYYSTNMLKGPEGAKWHSSERAIQVVLWPVFVVYFIYALFRG